MKPALARKMTTELNTPTDASSRALRAAQNTGQKTMPFAIRDLNVLAYTNGFTLWHYKAGSIPLEYVASDDFFSDAGDMLSAGDIIHISGTAGCTSLFVVTASRRGDHVTTHNMISV